MARRFTRRRLLRASLALGASTLPQLLGVPSLARSRRPNVLLVFTDQERHPLHLPPLHLPNRERLAAQALDFSHAYAGFPLCSPSRAVLLSGLYPPQTGVLENFHPLRGSAQSLAPSLPTLPSVFQRKRYDVGYFGKWHLSKPSELGRYHLGTTFVPENQNDGRNADPLIAERAAEWIRARSGWRPWLAVVSLVNPHDIFAPALYGATSVPERSVELPPNFRDDLLSEDRAPELRAYASSLANLPRDEAAWRAYLRLYCHLIETTDAQLGTLLDALGSAAENTVVVYTSDHGEMAGAHGLAQKRVMFEESLRVPLLVAYPPRWRERRRLDVAVSHADVVPTLAELAGLRWPSALPGWSLAAPESVPERPMIAVSHLGGGAPRRTDQLLQAIRTRSWKYVHYPSGAQELYDERSDPGELVNLAHDPDHAATVERLARRLRQGLARVSQRPRAL